MTKAANTQKVGSNDSKTDEAEKPDKKKKKTRVDFPVKAAMFTDKEGKVVTAINAEGLLLAVPVPILDGEKIVYAGYDLRKHNPLKKSDFASMATYLQYQGFVARERARRLVKLAETKEASATRLLKYGDESTRKKAAKLAKMRDQLAALTKQLESEGIDVNEI